MPGVRSKPAAELPAARLFWVPGMPRHRTAPFRSLRFYLLANPPPSLFFFSSPFPFFKKFNLVLSGLLLSPRKIP